MYYMKPLKSPTHIHFLTKNFYGFETVFCIMILWFSPCFYMRIMQSKNFAANIHTHYRQSEIAPHIYAHYTRGNFAPDVYENCGAFRICVGDWLSVGILAFVCIMFCICGHRLDKVVFCWLVDVKNRCKNVMKLHKLIVKMWLCICNCMCICVCMWRWLWFCCRLDSVVIRL